MTFAIVSTRFAVLLPQLTVSTPAQWAALTSLPISGVNVAFVGVTVYESGSGLPGSLIV
jgi:hypothetical protein